MPTFPFYPVSEQHENNNPIMWYQLITLVLGLNTKCSPTGSWIKHLVLNLRCYFKYLWENQEEINHRMFPLPWYSEAPWAQNQYHHQLWTGTSEKMSKINSSYILLLLFGIWSQWCKENRKKAHIMSEKWGCCCGWQYGSEVFVGEIRKVWACGLGEP